jgi:predicted TIM-barrel fold metal-dependent hydrolase
VDTSIFSEPKIDCHVHVLDPVAFPYAPDTHYRPAGQETATAALVLQLLDAYGARHALIVGTNSGYGFDNRCMLDAVARSGGRFKGVAVVPNDASTDELAALRERGVVGVAWNVTHTGSDYFAGALPLLERLRELGLFVQVQVEHDQLVPLVPMLERSGVRIVVDHCGRPTPEAGIGQPGFRALLGLASSRRTVVKISGLVKFSRAPYPHTDARPFIDALLDAFTPEACMWASDWPYLRAPVRVDYGLLLALALQLFPDPRLRRKIMWETPARLLGFAA